MSPSTAGARHLAESANCLAWERDNEPAPPRGTLMETAFLHWSATRLAAFLSWYRRLPGGPQ